MQKEHIVKEGTFVPNMGIEYPEKPNQRILTPKYIKDIKVDENYPFLMKSFKEKFFQHLIYAGIFTLVYPMQRIRYGLKIEGRKNLKDARKLLSHGALVVCNHVYRWDFLAALQAVGHRKMWFPTFADNINSTDALLIRSAGGIPIPESGFSATKKFNEAFDTLHKKKKWILVFPESCRWNWYQPIRPFKTGAFSLAYRYNIPVVPVVLHYREAKGLRKLLGIKHPLVTVSIGEVLMPDVAKNRKEEARALCIKAHDSMCSMAGIIQNGWDAILEE